MRNSYLIAIGKTQPSQLLVFFENPYQPCFQFSSLRFNHHQMPRSTSCLFHSAQPTRKLHLFAVTCMSRSLPVFLSYVYIVSLFKNWDGPYLYSAGHSVLTKLVPNQTVMSVRPISGWLKVGLPIKMRTIKPPMGKWYKYCFNFKTDFWLMTKLILFLLIKTITIKPCFN